MYLMGADQSLGSYPAPDSRAVFIDICRIVAGTEAHIETRVPPTADPAVSGEKMIGNHRFGTLSSVWRQPSLPPKE